MGNFRGAPGSPEALLEPPPRGRPLPDRRPRGGSAKHLLPGIGPTEARPPRPDQRARAAERLHALARWSSRSRAVRPLSACGQALRSHPTSSPGPENSMRTGHSAASAATGPRRRNSKLPEPVIEADDPFPEPAESCGPPVITARHRSRRGSARPRRIPIATRCSRGCASQPRPHPRGRPCRHVEGGPGGPAIATPAIARPRCGCLPEAGCGARIRKSCGWPLRDSNPDHPCG